jgi:TP901 family phage tail tape measure protein
MALRTVGVKLTADVAGYMAGLRQAKTATRDLLGEMDKAAQAGRLDQVADQAAMMGVGLLGAAAMASKFAMDFEKQMSAVQAATKASTADMERLRRAALQAGKDTSFSATEAAQGIEELAKAGVSTTAILTGGLRGALDLAAAGGLSVAESAEVAASALTQFKLKGADVPHVADLLAAAAGKAQGSVHDMGMALNQAGLVAAQTGLSIEETTGGLAAFAAAGLMGSDAGTSFKQMLLMLQAPSGSTKGLMDELGISLYDAAGNAKGLAQFAGELKTKMSTLTPEARAAAMATIFGADAVRGASILYEQGAEGIQAWIDKTNDAGYAAETAAMRTDNLAGDIERLKGSLETLAIESASGPNSGLRVLVQGLDGLVGELSELPPAVGSTLTVMAALGGATALLGAGWVRARRANLEFREELAATGPAGTRAARGLEATTKWAGRATVAFAALQITGAIVSKMVGELNPQIDAMSKGLEAWGKSGQLAGESARVLGGDLADLNVGLKFLADTDNDRRKFARWGQDLLEGVVPGLDSTNTSLTRTRERVTAMDQAFAQMVSAGNAEGAKAAFDRLAAEAAKSGVSVDELRKLFPQYAAALETTGKAAAEAVSPTSSLTGVTKEYKTVAEAAAAATDGQRDALIALADMMKAEADPVFGLLDAQQKLTQAQKESAEAVKEHGRNSEEAKEATRKLALAAIELQSKAGELSGTFNGEMTPALAGTLRAAGLTERQIKDVAAQFRTAKSEAEKYDGKYQAHVSVVGGPAAEDRLKRLSIYQQALKKGTIPVGFQGPFQGKDYHSGGWTGPGEKYQPAGVVHADEFVIKKESRHRIEQRHPGLLDEMNATGQLPGGYAAGGLVVRLPYPTTAAMTRIPSRSEVAGAVMPAFGPWPSSPADQRGDSGLWRGIVALIRGSGPLSGEFGNAYRPGDPKWHGSGRAVDWMGYNQDALARFLAARRPLELIHRTASRDYAYTRGVNRGSFSNALMEAHRNHIHIAMAGGGRIEEPVFGFGASGRTYSFGERGPETVVPGIGAAAGGGGTVVVNRTINVTVNVPPGANLAEVGRLNVEAIRAYEQRSGPGWRMP